MCKCAIARTCHTNHRLLLLQLEHVEKVRQTNDTQLQDIRQQIDEKLKSADEKRDEIIKQLQEKLRLHVTRPQILSKIVFYWISNPTGRAH